MVDKMCAAYGLPLVETGVGFKYICAEMLKGGVLLGAEESGGIGFPGHIPERDGIAAGLMLLELLATEKVSVNKLLARLEKQFGPHRYGRIDTHYPLEKRAALMEFLKNNPPAKLLRSPLAEVKTFDGVKFVAAGFLVADAARFRHGTGSADLRRGEVRRRRAKTFEARRVIDAALKFLRHDQHGILNPQILSLLARVRHTNALVIADRGFPFWPMIETVDVSLVDDVPTVLQVIAAVARQPQFHAGLMARNS